MLKTGSTASGRFDESENAKNTESGGARESKGSREAMMGKRRRNRLRGKAGSKAGLTQVSRLPGILSGLLLFGDNTAAAELSVPAALLINCKVWLLVRAWVAGGLQGRHYTGAVQSSPFEFD